MKKELLVILICVFMIMTAIPLVGSTNEITSSSNTAKWTVMVYLDADNSAENPAMLDFAEMASVGSYPDVNIVVQFDRINGYDASNGDWTTAKRFFVTQGMEPVSASANEDLGEVNMGDPNTLIDFIKWSMDFAPAENYLLVLWDHGGGWRGLCLDETSNDRLTIDELSYALSQVPKIDLIGFNACLMQMMEVSYEMANYCDYMLGSEAVMMNYNSFCYDKILNDLRTDPTMTPLDVGKKLVDYDDVLTLSLIDLTKIRGLTDKISDLASSLMDKTYTEELDNLSDLVEDYDYIYSIKLDYKLFQFNAGFVDLYDLVELINDHIPEISDKAQIVLNEIKSAVICNNNVLMPGQMGYPDPHGISIYFPNDFNYYDNIPYKELSFSKDSSWDEFLDWYHKIGDNQPPLKPTISGPTTGKKGEDLTYTFVTTDPEENKICYIVDWDDTILGRETPSITYTQYYNSSEAVDFYAKYTNAGDHTILVLAIDEYGARSEWSSFTVTIKKRKSDLFVDFLNKVVDKVADKPIISNILNQIIEKIESRTSDQNVVVNPVTPQQPTNPIINPTNPSSQPTTPTNPTEPTNPTAPTTPTKPTDPTSPVNPTTPSVAPQQPVSSNPVAEAGGPYTTDKSKNYVVPFDISGTKISGVTISSSTLSGTIGKVQWRWDFNNDQKWDIWDTSTQSADGWQYIPTTSGTNKKIIPTLNMDYTCVVNNQQSGFIRATGSDQVQSIRILYAKLQVKDAYNHIAEDTAKITIYI